MHSLGIDIAKVKFDVRFLAGDKSHSKAFANSMKGFEELLQWLRSRCDCLQNIHSCMEGTGKLWEPLAEYLHNNSIKVSVVNPMRIKGFGQSELKRSKTDAIDADMIARFCFLHKPDEWTPPPEENKQLRDIQRYIDALKAQRTQEINRLKSGPLNSIVEASIREHIEYLDQQIEVLEKQLSKAISTSEKLSAEVKLLTSIIGVGQTTAITFIGELASLQSFANAKELEVFCGLTPRLFQSGTSVKGRPRISKAGNRRMRKAMYMPALSALRFNPRLQEFAQRLKQAGKPGKVVVCAVMRKLLRIMFAVLKSGKPFDIHYLQTATC